jgi:hypothetical protein
MRRSRRLAFHLAAGASLIVWLAAAVLWVRSYYVGDRFVRDSWEERGDFAYFTERGVRIGRGLVRFGESVQEFPRVSPDGTTFRQRMDKYWMQVGRPPYYRRTMPARPGMGMDAKVDWAGFQYGRYEAPKGKSAGSPASMVQVIVPLWAVVAAATPLPATWVFRWWRRRRASFEGKCRGCGYDLRATPERCPECGRFA